MWKIFQKNPNTDFEKNWQLLLKNEIVFSKLQQILYIST